MRKALMTTAAALLVLTAIPVTPTGTDTVENEILFVSSNGESWRGTDHPGGCSTESFGGYLGEEGFHKGGIPLLGDNPIPTGCEKEDHVAGFGFITIGFPNPNGDITGVTTAQVQSDNGVVEFACSWVAGASTGQCLVRDLAWPDLGMDFEFTCWSEFALPEKLGHVGPSAGSWECFIDHF